MKEKRSAMMEENMINQCYLPFTEQQLQRHFVSDEANGNNLEKWVAYYLNSAKRYQEYRQQGEKRIRSLREKRLPCQIEKDERFWTAAALLSLFYSSDRINSFSMALTKAFGPTPPVAYPSWTDALYGDLQLFFEVDLPSPSGYKEWLRRNIVNRQLIPYIREAAQYAGAKANLEGPTQADAVLINPTNGFSVIFEAKVLSDISYQVSYDSMRNQLVRNIDVMLECPKTGNGSVLEKRDPARSFFVLLTPELFQTGWQSRLYGWLMREYRNDPTALKRDLPHRDYHDLQDIQKRLGWLTWEDCRSICTTACAWLE